MKVNLHGGPYGGKWVSLSDEKIGFLTVGNNKGHYGRVTGGKNDHFYWYECPPPIAVGNSPVREAKEPSIIVEGEDS